MRMVKCWMFTIAFQYSWEDRCPRAFRNIRSSICTYAQAHINFISCNQMPWTMNDKFRNWMEETYRLYVSNLHVLHRSVCLQISISFGHTAFDFQLNQINVFARQKKRENDKTKSKTLNIHTHAKNQNTQNMNPFQSLFTFQFSLQCYRRRDKPNHLSKFVIILLATIFRFSLIFQPMCNWFHVLFNEIK